MESIRSSIESLNVYIGRSTFGRIFRLGGCGHKDEILHTKFTTEVRAGLTSFFTMAYIIAVNATILADTGGNCVCNDATDPICLTNTEYLICKQDLNRNLITATAAVAGFSSFLFGFFTNMPVCLAPGMGLNAYFAYQIVGFHGTGLISYNLALTAVFAEGFIFIFLSLIGMRQWLVKIIPVSLKIAAACGIGLFLAEVGLSANAGIGAIAGSKSTPLDIAGCPDQYKDEFGSCTSHKMTSPTMWLGIMGGGILTAYLMTYKVKSAMILAILLVSIISWPRGTSVTFFPYNEVGDNRFEFFKKVVDFHPINRTLNALDWDVNRAPGHFALALFTFLYVDIIDCTATLYSMARFSGVVDAETGDFPRSTIALHGRFLHLHGCTPWLFTCDGFHRERCWDCRRWQNWINSHDLWCLFSHIHVLRSYLCFDTAMGYWKHIDPGWLPHDATNLLDQLAVHRRCDSSLRNRDVHSLRIQRGLRSYCGFDGLHCT